jgi:two-component system, OmpR family, sensor histidine kinase CiaH
MNNNHLTRSFNHSRVILTLWYIVFCLALIALLNFGAFTAQTASLSEPTRSISSGTDSSDKQASATVSIQNDRKQEVTTTVDAIRKRFDRQLIVVNSLLILVAVIFSYILSGLTLRPIRQTLKEQEEFAQEVSHELRTPLSVMALEVEALKRGGQAASAAAQNISGEVARMNQLVDGLLTLIRPADQNRHANTSTSFDVTAAARKAFNQHQKLATSKHLDYQFASTYDGTAYARESDIVQCLGILLDNAIKYTNKGGTIKLSVTPAAGHRVDLAVSDTGQGIAKTDLSHIFERFYRARHQPSTDDTGLGLGLAIAQKRVTANNGTIKLESTLGQGTTAHIFLSTK